jgi:hypothetical protein
MLKPVEPDPDGSEATDERPIGELVQQLVADGKAYAEAELNVGKAIVQEKVDGLKLPAALGFGALLFLQAAVVILGMTVYATLVSRLGPFLAGLIATLLFLAVAGGLAWFAARKLRELL